MDIAGALSAVSVAISITKDLREVDRGLSEAEQKLKIADLTSTLADAKMALTDVQEQLRDKDKQIEDLKERFAFRGELIEVNEFKYENRLGQPYGHAFCPRCEVVDGRLIRLVDSYKPGRLDTCPQCGKDYMVGDYR